MKYEDEDGSWIDLAEDSPVSLNFWGFTLDVFEELEIGFLDFLKTNEKNIEKAEFYLPNFVGDLLDQKKAEIRVLPTNEHWYGVTYREDMPIVKQAVEKMIEDGKYPNKL